MDLRKTRSTTRSTIEDISYSNDHIKIVDDSLMGIKEKQVPLLKEKSDPRIIDLEEVEHAVELLASEPNISLNDLDQESEIYQAYQHVLMAMTIFHNTNYDQFLDILDKQPKPTSVYPGTAGAFLFGQFNICYGDADKWCSPISLGSIPRNNTGEDWAMKSCPEQIWLLKNGTISAISSTETCKAVVYVDYDNPKDFKGLTQDEINYLKNSGVKEVRVLSSKGPRHRTLLSRRSIDTVPVRQGSTRLSDGNGSDGDINDFDDGSNSDSGGTPAWPWVVLGIIVIIVIAIIIWFLIN